MNAEALLREIRSLEVELHQPETWSHTRRLDALLHDAFLELGRSGRRYDKSAVIAAQLRGETARSARWSQDFSVQAIASGVALLTYRSADRQAGGGLARHANRASLWQRTARGWQMRFHQGTATEAFPAERSGETADLPC